MPAKADGDDKASDIAAAIGTNQNYPTTVTVYTCFKWRPPMAGFLFIPSEITLRAVITECSNDSNEDDPDGSTDSQRGQILVIFAGGLVLILLVAALVIDLGFTFMIRRAEQNAADPGAIAAARYIRTGAGLTPEPVRMRQAACSTPSAMGSSAGPAGM